jgi:HK97 family phage portal protein
MQFEIELTTQSTRQLTTNFYRVKKSNPSKARVAKNKSYSRRVLPVTNMADGPLRNVSRAASQNWRYNLNQATASGNVIDHDNVLTIDTVFACIRVLSETMAALPLELLKREETGSGRERSVTIEKAVDHPVFELLRWQANEEMSAYELRLWMMVDCLIRGRGVAQVVRDGKGKPIELWPLCASKLTPMRNTDTGKLFYKYGQSESSGGQGETFLELNEVFTFQMMQYAGLVGFSMVQLQREAFGAAKASETYSSEFFGNGSALSGILEVPEEMNEEAYERLRNDWKRNHSGSSNRHGVPILEGGATFNPMALNHEETQLLETRKFQRSAIAGLFRVPSHLINDLEKASYSNIQNVDIGFVKHTLTPWMANIEQRCRIAFLSDDEKKNHVFRHDNSALLRGDFKSRAEGYSKLAQIAAVSANDVREAEGMNTYEGGDKYFVNGALIDINAPPEPEESPQAPPAEE